MRAGEIIADPVLRNLAQAALVFGIPAAMQQALQALRLGQAAEAAAIYYAVLERDPENFDAIHCAGLAEFDCRNYARAVYLVRAAVALHPEIAIARDNLARIEELMALIAECGTAPLPRPQLTLTPATLGVSVVMPAYNHDRFIAAAIESVLDQTVAADEVIVVDDGSTDATAQIIARYPVSLIRQANQGAHAALNRGLELARGRQVALMNSDDLWAPNRLERMLPALASAGLAFSMSRFIDATDQPIPADAPYLVHLDAGMNEAIRRGTPAPVLRRCNIALSTGNLVFRRELLEAIGGFAPYRICHDWDFLLAACRTTQVVMVPARLYAYRLHAHNTYAGQGARGRFEMEQILGAYQEAPETA